MARFPQALQDKLAQREQDSALRKLPVSHQEIDFSSNDYLGFAQSEVIFQKTHELLLTAKGLRNGATGSRLISGNHPLFAETEPLVAAFHQSESALLFNSGYDANVGFFSSVPQRNDVILYDELAHASMRDGIRMSNAKSFKFAHNDLENLAGLLAKHQTPGNEIYIATESVFSMDGDSPNLGQMAILAEKHRALLIVDEAHALGVFGDRGAGLIQQLHLENQVFARIVTFGKGLGCHGAAVLGQPHLKEFLINFARSFIYTTGLSPHAVATILVVYSQLETTEAIEKLRDNILFFNHEKNRLGLKPLFVRSKSAIQSAIIPGNANVKKCAAKLQQNGFDVRAILSPTVPEGQERLRICLHSYNSENEIAAVLKTLANCIF